MKRTRKPRIGTRSLRCYLPSCVCTPHGRSVILSGYARQGVAVQVLDQPPVIACQRNSEGGPCPETGRRWWIQPTPAQRMQWHRNWLAAREPLGQLDMFDLLAVPS